MILHLLPTALAQPAGPPPQWELWKINVDGIGLARFADTPERDPIPAFAESMRVRHCSFSPDGSRIIFGATPKRPSTLEVNGTPHIYEEIEQLFVLDLQHNGKPVPFPPNRNVPGPASFPARKYVESCPDWSPDGQTIVFVRQLKKGEKQ